MSKSKSELTSWPWVLFLLLAALIVLGVDHVSGWLLRAH